MNKRINSVVATVATMAMLLGCGGGESPSTTSTGSGGSGGGGTTASVTSGSSTSGATTTTSAASTGGTGGAMPAHPLDEGDYAGTVTAVTSDTCNGFASAMGLAPVTLQWTSATSFDLAYQDGALECALDQAAGSCMPYMQVVNVDSSTALTVKSAGGPVAVVSSTEFTFTEALVVECAGSGCAAFAMSAKTTFPCGATLAEDYAM